MANPLLFAPLSEADHVPVLREARSYSEQMVYLNGALARVIAVLGSLNMDGTDGYPAGCLEAARHALMQARTRLQWLKATDWQPEPRA
jgi:hypothetical protein